MSRKNLLLIIACSLLFALAAAPLAAQDKQKKNPPFLITGKLPHMTKQVMEQWDNPGFNLSEKQKTKLLAVRKETVTGAQNLAKKIGPLEQQVVDGILAGKTPAELASTVEQIAQLKAEATMIHLQCIAKTLAILTDQQEAMLK